MTSLASPSETTISSLTTTTLQPQASALPYNPCEEAYVTSLASPGPTRDQEDTMPELSPLSSISRVSHTTAHPESNVSETSSLLDKKVSFSQFVEDLIANSNNCEEKDNEAEEEEPQPIHCDFNLTDKKVPKKVFPPARVRGPGGATKPPIVNKNLSQSKVIDKTHEEDEDGDLMICLQCAYPMSYVSEMISHQTECPSKPFQGSDTHHQRRKKHFFVFCKECSCLANKVDFHLLKTHLKDQHDKDAKITDTYFIFRIDEASESIDVSVSQHLNQFEEPTRLNLEEDPAWRPEELESRSDDDSTDSEPPIPKKKSVERPTSAKPQKSLFCADLFAHCRSLRRHFQRGNQVKDKTVQSLYQRCHLIMEAKDKTIKKFLCTKCNQLCHMKSRQKVKNSDGRYKHPHIPSWVTITSL